MLTSFWHKSTVNICLWDATLFCHWCFNIEVCCLPMYNSSLKMDNWLVFFVCKFFPPFTPVWLCRLKRLPATVLFTVCLPGASNCFLLSCRMDRKHYWKKECRILFLPCYCFLRLGECNVRYYFDDYIQNKTPLSTSRKSESNEILTFQYS